MTRELTLNERMNRLERLVVLTAKELLITKELMAIKSENDEKELKKARRLLAEREQTEIKNESSEVMYVKDCAKLLGVKEQRVRYLVGENAIPYYKSRGRLIFKRSEIEAICFANRQPTIEELESLAATQIELNKRNKTRL